MARIRIEVPVLSAEFSDADLGDVRLNRRLGLLAERLGERPGESFPKALDDAELEAAYRFFGNDSVSPEAILVPHFRQTARRAAKHGHLDVAGHAVSSGVRQPIGFMRAPAFCGATRSPAAAHGDRRSPHRVPSVQQ